MPRNRRKRSLYALAALTAVISSRAGAQRYPTNDPVIKQLWEQGMTDRSQAAALAQALMDSIGPRLHGSRGHDAAVEWLLGLYQRWGITARKERYGTWKNWRRGYTHLD